MPQLRHKRTHRKVGRKRYPNKSIKVKERAYTQARQLEDNAPLRIPTLAIVLDLGTDKLCQLIRSITKDNEDAFQDAWLAVLEDHVASEEDILQIAKDIYHRHCAEEVGKQCREISLSEPIGTSNNEVFTYESLLRSPEEENTATRLVDWNSDFIEDLIKYGDKAVCKFCQSTYVVKYGCRGKSRAQYWRCKECGHVFTCNGAFPKMQYPQYVVREAIRLRVEGLTLREIKGRLEARYKIRMSGIAVLWQWFRKAGVSPPDKYKWKKNYPNLCELLGANCKRLTVYSQEYMLRVCGYSLATKIEDTQICRRGAVRRQNGGWLVSVPVYLDVSEEASQDCAVASA